VRTENAFEVLIARGCRMFYVELDAGSRDLRGKNEIERDSEQG
jgi:hypothetical protein